MSMINEALREMYRFLTLKVLFPLQYKRYAGKKVQHKKAVFIESQLPKLSSSMESLYSRLEEEGDWQLSLHCLRESFSSKKVFIRKALSCLKDIADAEFVFLCDANRLVSCIPKRKETTVVQLWHGCGAFKKFGMSTADLLFGGNRKNYEKYPYYGNLDYVTVSSPEVIWAYEEAMNLKKNSGQVQPVGVIRTDIFFQDCFRKEAYHKVRESVPGIKDRKIMLYAPTFRGNVSSATAPDQLDIVRMKEELSDEYVLLIKHHPVIRKRPEIPESAKEFAFDVSDTLGIEDLLCVSDICISDYSSLIFEFSLFEKPMIFFAYDLAEYDDWRGFYYDYNELTPGPVFAETEEIIQYIQNLKQRFHVEEVRAFRDRFMSACDGHATDKLLKLLEIRR